MGETMELLLSYIYTGQVCKKKGEKIGEINRWKNRGDTFLHLHWPGLQFKIFTAMCHMPNMPNMPYMPYGGSTLARFAIYLFYSRYLRFLKADEHIGSNIQMSLTKTTENISIFIFQGDWLQECLCGGALQGGRQVNCNHECIVDLICWPLVFFGQSF